MSDFSRLLRRRRQEAHLTQAHLAQRVGVDQQTVSRWEREASAPTQDVLSRIARAFGEPDDEWVRIAGHPTASESLRLLPPVRPLMDRLPLAELTPSEFERFSSYFLKAYYPGANIARVGGPGHAQGGADILVHTDEGIHLFQCKRNKRFGPAQMRSAASAAAANAAEKRVVMLSRVATPDARMAATSVGWEIWDHDDVVRMLQQEVSPESARQVMKPFFSGWTEDFLGIRASSPWAQPDEYFAGLTDESTYSHSHELIGRDHEIAEVLAWVRSDSQFLLLTGSAGVGKSRFLMEVARQIHSDAGGTVVYFADGTVVFDDFQRLNSSRTVILVDDAHGRSDARSIIRGTRSNSRDQQRVRVVFATRNYHKPRLLRELARHAHDIDPPSVHLDPLKHPDAVRLASRVLGEPEDSPRVLRLAAVTRDCTLLLVAAGYLLRTRHVDPTFLDDEERFRDGVLDRMYRDYIRSEVRSKEISVDDVLKFVATVQPFDFDDGDALEAASSVLDCPRDVVTSALGEMVKTGVVVKRGPRLRLQPDLLADHILVRACFDRSLGRATGYSDRIWRDCGALLRRNFIVNVARIDWRLSVNGESYESMLVESWRYLEREFKRAGISKRLELLQLLEKVAFYQPERTLELLEWALDHELPPERAVFGVRKYDCVRIRVAPVLRVCAYHREWVGRTCELLWRLAQSDCRDTNPQPDHPIRILCDLAAYSRNKPFDHTQRVIRHAIGWLGRDSAKLAFDILDQALVQEFDDRTSDGYSFTISAHSALLLGRERVLALRTEVLGATIRHFFGNDAPLAVRAAKSLGLALSRSFGSFGRQPDANEMAVWESESVELLKRISHKLIGARLAPPAALALREAVEPMTGERSESALVVANKVLNAIADDLDHQIVEVLIYGPWRWLSRPGSNQEPSPEEVHQRLNDLAQRFLAASDDTSTAVRNLGQHLRDIRASSEASGASNFTAALVRERLSVGVEIACHVIADADSPLNTEASVALSTIRAADPSSALVLAQNLIDTGRPTARMSVARAYGWGLAVAPVISEGELALIRKLGASGSVEEATELSHGLRFMAERDPRMALLVILEMRIGRSEQLTAEVLRLFIEAGPLRICKLKEDELESIVAQVVACNRIEDYWIQGFISALSHAHLRTVLRLLKKRVEHAETLNELGDYRAVPHRWHDKWRLDSRGARDRRRILEELLDWAAEDGPGWSRHHGSPVIFATVVGEFDEEALRAIEDGLSSRAGNVGNVANLLSQVPRGFVWSHVQWIVRTLEDAARRDVGVYRSIGDALQSAVRSGVRTGKPGEPFPEDVKQRDRARGVADGLPAGSPGERFYRSLQRSAEQAIEWKRERDEDRGGDWA